MSVGGLLSIGGVLSVGSVTTGFCLFGFMCGFTAFSMSCTSVTFTPLDLFEI